MKFQRVSDEELREAGIDPAWLSEPDEDGGPYVVHRDNNGICGQCHGRSVEWFVVDLSQCVALGVSWSHDDGEVDAQEHASHLNHAWLAGYAARGLLPDDQKGVEP